MRVLQNVCGKARINDKFYYYKDILNSMNSKVLRVFMEKKVYYIKDSMRGFLLS